MLGIDFLSAVLVRSEPGEHKRNAIPFRHRKLRDRGQIFAVRFNRRPQDQTVRSRDSLKPAVAFPHPWNDLPVIKANDQLHLHRHFAAQPFDDPNDVGILAARRHEIDQAHGAAFRFDFRFQNERVASISASRSLDLLIGMEKPAAIFSGRRGARQNTPANRTAESKANQRSRRDSRARRFACR